MTNKRKGLLLVAIYIILVLLAIPLHTQKGIDWNDQFYRLTDENTFIANKNNRFSYTETEGVYQFDLLVDGYACSAELTQPEKGTYHIAFNDGFTLILSGNSWGGVSVGGDFYPFSDGASLIVIDDLDKTPLRFAPYVIETQPIYDGETGKKIIGEWVNYKTEAGEHFYGYETWNDGTQFGTPPTIVTLENGTVLDQTQFNNGSTLYVNEKGEMLINDTLLRSFPYAYSEDRVNRQNTCWLMINAALKERVESRGEAVVFFLSRVYFLGVSQLLWPEEMAFFGSRWQYRYEPELSDAGLMMSRISAVIIMIFGAVVLYLPLVIR